MPRIARKDLKSTYHHIIVQGINREYIFEQDYQKEYYKLLLKNNLKDINVNVLAYCIMDNHAHILIQSNDTTEITKLMQKTNTSYARYYNNINKRVGYVFRDRYYVQDIVDERQLMNCISYIHKNPIKANIVNNLSEYKYSSYSEYFNKDSLVNKEGIKLVFGADKNYKETFKQIHEIDNIENISEIFDEIIDSKIVIDKFLKDNELTFSKILLDEIKLGELLLKLRFESRISLRKMSEIFNINKDKLNKILNNALKG